MSGLNNFMNEKHTINRWKVLIVFLSGMFCGVALGTIFFLSALIG